MDRGYYTKLRVVTTIPSQLRPSHIALIWPIYETNFFAIGDLRENAIYYFPIYINKMINPVLGYSN